MISKNLKYTCAHKYLLSIYVIHNYIIYRFVFPNPKSGFTYLHIRIIVRIRVIYIGLDKAK